MKDVCNSQINVSKDIVLTHLCKNDQNTLCLLLSDIEVTQKTQNIPYPYTQTHAQEWIGLQLGKQGKDITKVWAIRYQSDLIGLIGVNQFKARQGLADIGYWLGKNHWNKGIMSKVISCFMTTLVQHWNVKKIQAWVKKNNLASQKILEKNNFTLSSSKDGTHLRFVYQDDLVRKKNNKNTLFKPAKTQKKA